MRNRYHTFTVEGRGEFPIDMLRYDRCWPSDPNSVANLSAPWHGASREERLKFLQISRKIHLTMYDEAGTGPTVGRWSSFMWYVQR